MVLTNVLGAAYTIRATIPALKETTRPPAADELGRRPPRAAGLALQRDEARRHGDGRVRAPGAQRHRHPRHVDRAGHGRHAVLRQPAARARSSPTTSRARCMYAISQPPHVDVNEILDPPDRAAAVAAPEPAGWPRSRRYAAAGASRWTTSQTSRRRCRRRSRASAARSRAATSCARGSAAGRRRRSTSPTTRAWIARSRWRSSSARRARRRRGRASTREAQVTGRLGDHPNIITVYDTGEHDGVPYLVLRAMPGGSLADLLAARRPSIDRHDPPRPRDRARARPRARPRRRAPRRQARQRLARRRRQRRARRLRHRAAGRPRAADRRGRRARHRPLPVARADPRRATSAPRATSTRSASRSTSSSPAARRSSPRTRRACSRST